MPLSGDERYVSLDFLADAAPMAQRFRELEWSRTPLGSVENWSALLKNLVGVMIAAGHPMFILWGEQRVLLYNDAFAALLGGAARDALGGTCSGQWQSLLANLMPSIERAFGGVPVKTELPVTHDRGIGKAGATFEYALSPIRSERGVTIGVAGSCRESSPGCEERSNDVQRKEAWLRTIFETSYQLQGLLAPDGRLIDANATLLAVIQAGFEEVADRLFWDTPWFASTPGLPDWVRAGVARAAQGEHVRDEVSMNVPGGVRCYDFSLRPIRDARGTVFGIVAEAIEITERRQAEEALRHTQRLEAMGQLTGGVAHDFNNLLAPIVASLDMLNRPGLPAERVKQLVERALLAADRAKTLVHRLLAFARRQPLQPTAVDVAGLVTGMGNLLASTVGPQIKVAVSAESGLPAAHADANQLEMAIVNLCLNARDAMPDGGTLRISATLENVRRGNPAKLLPGAYVRVSVADTGIGMDAATRRRAIEPFFSTKGIGKSTGLGLSMAHGVALQLGGTLTLTSKLGIGTNVELWLPMSTSSPQAAALVDAGVLLHGGAGIVLLVDDDEIVRTSTADMLLQIGSEVREAASGEEALHAIGRGLNPDLVITDHLMPGMTGVDLAYSIRERQPHIPVLVISGFADIEGIAPDLPRLTKPFRQSELAASVARLRPTVH